MIETLTAHLFFDGDTGHGVHFRTIRRRCGTIDVALLPISCLKRRQDDHLTANDAVKAHCDLKARLSIAMQFGAFASDGTSLLNLALEVQRALEGHGVSPRQFIVPLVGESVAVT